jgi:hypothetical protein
VYEAMMATLNVPAKDHFQIITEHSPDTLIYDPEYLDIPRTNGIIDDAPLELETDHLQRRDDGDEQADGDLGGTAGLPDVAIKPPRRRPSARIPGSVSAVIVLGQI